MGTDCKSLFDLCVKVGSLPDERRVALDLLDVREVIEELKDQIRWVPTDHMLADAFTKSMPPDLLLRYLKDGKYSFKYDDEIKNTKREQAKVRADARKNSSKAAHVKVESCKAEACNYVNLVPDVLERCVASFC